MQASSRESGEVAATSRKYRDRHPYWSGRSGSQTEALQKTHFRNVPVSEPPLQLRRGHLHPQRHFSWRPPIHYFRWPTLALTFRNPFNLGTFTEKLLATGSIWILLKVNVHLRQHCRPVVRSNVDIYETQVRIG